VIGMDAAFVERVAVMTDRLKRDGPGTPATATVYHR
jgi:hypothetical protein